MLNPTKLEELTNNIIHNLPSGDQIRDDLKNNLKSVLNATFERMELVTREEFEVQAKLLVNTRLKLEQMEQQVAELEQALKQGAATDQPEDRR